MNAELNAGPSTNTFVFGVLTVLMQIAMCIIYGVLIKVPPYETADPVGPVDFANITITVLFFFFVLLGNDYLISRLRCSFWVFEEMCMVCPWIQSPYCLPYC